MKDTRQILEQLKNGDITIDEALTDFKQQPYEDLGYAKVDLHRKLRKGVAEVIYGAGKTAEQIAGIIHTMLAADQGLVLITRLDADKAAAVAELLNPLAKAAASSAKTAAPSDRNATSSAKAATPQVPLSRQLESGVMLKYYDKARIGIVGEMPEPNGLGKIVIATGGTSDIPVAEEAAVTAEALGNEVVRLYDVGVAGIHRLFDKTDEIVNASVVIAIAGMEGALASVIGGLASCPVIAVPTSVGYGASFDGLAALLSMLNSCATGVSVVNIDNGFGAGYLAHKINHMGMQK